MTREFEQMLQLAAIGATGHSIDVDCTDIDWKKVVNLAKVQRMDGYLAYALKNNDGLSCPDEIRDPLIQRARVNFLSNAYRRNAIINLLEEMEASGIHVVLLKGYAIAECYALPESRMSSDTDIWIEPKDEESACAFMRARGFSVEPRWKTSHHAVCYHPHLGCVELHVNLYGGMAENFWFAKSEEYTCIKEAHILIETQDGSYNTLGYTDHFTFLVLHMIKHFIACGLTLQMIFDIGLYFKKHANKIDIERVQKIIRKLRYDGLLNCIMWTMIQYCGFNLGDFPAIGQYIPDHVKMILDDLEKGGWMGFADEPSREECKYEYNRQILMADKSKMQYVLRMFRWKFSDYLRTLFPTSAVLSTKYPYVQKSILLMPYAWVHRLLFRGVKALKNGKLASDIIVDETKVSVIGKERVKMFRDLNMMD